jgi:hypothetical protein
MAVTLATSKPFNPFSLDAINFLLADVRGALGPYLNVFLVTQQHWSQTEVDIVGDLVDLIALLGEGEDSGPAQPVPAKNASS